MTKPVPSDPSPFELVEAVERHQTDLAIKWARVQGGGVWESPEVVVTIVGLPVPYTNTIHRARLAPDNAEEVVAATADLLREQGVRGIWWVGPLTTPQDLPSVLIRHGFRHEEAMPWMASRLDELFDSGLPDGLEAFRVSNEELHAAWLEAMTLGFGMDANDRAAMSRLAEAVGYEEGADWQRFVALKDGRPIASSGVMFGGGVAGIYNMATAPDARGKGVGAAMATLAMRCVRARGYGVAVLGSAARAVSLYDRLGFRHVCHMSVFEWRP